MKNNFTTLSISVVEILRNLAFQGPLISDRKWKAEAVLGERDKRSDS